MAEKTKRIEIIDAARGLAVVLMVIHHFLLDLHVLLGAPYSLFSNPVFDILHYIFAGLFIFLAGVSSNFSRNNMRRGAVVFIIAMGMTIVTGLMDSIIRFGVLHLLGFCMITYALTKKVWDSVPKAIMPIFCIAGIVGSALLVEYVDIGDAAAKILFPFGWTYSGFYSADWFPIFPWMFVFLLGTWAGYYIKERRLPGWFYEAKFKLFPAIGRRSLIIYIVHQPVLYGLIYLYKFIFGTL